MIPGRPRQFAGREARRAPPASVVPLSQLSKFVVQIAPSFDKEA
jgi:hypothetical protein